MSEIPQFHLFSGEKVQRVSRAAITNPHVTNIRQSPTQFRCDVGQGHGQGHLSLIMPAGLDEYKLFFARDDHYGGDLDCDLNPSCLLGMLNGITPDITEDALFKLCNA